MIFSTSTHTLTDTHTHTHRKAFEFVCVCVWGYTLSWPASVSRSHRSCRATSQPRRRAGWCCRCVWRGTAYGGTTGERGGPHAASVNYKSRRTDMFCWEELTVSSFHSPAACCRSWWCWWSRTGCGWSHSCSASSQSLRPGRHLRVKHNQIVGYSSLDEKKRRRRRISGQSQSCRFKKSSHLVRNRQKR